MNPTNNEDTIGNWPYCAWNSIALTLAQILEDNGNTSLFEVKAKKLNDFLDDISKCSKCLIPVPVTILYSEEWQNTLRDCKCFNVWLFGQLVEVKLRENFKYLHEKCFKAQVMLLHYLQENDFSLYRNTFNSYIYSLEEICAALKQQKKEQEQPLFVFKWFQFDCSNPFMKLSPTEYRIDSFNKVIEYVNFLISIIISQNYELISDFCVSVSPLLWRCALDLLVLKNQQTQFTKFQIYKFIKYLLDGIQSLHHSSSNFDSTLSKLLEHIMNDVSILCQTGKLPNEESFCAMVNVLADKLDSNIICFDYFYPQMMYFLLLQHNVQLPELVEDTMLKLLKKLFQFSDYSSLRNLLENSISSNNVNHAVLVSEIDGLLRDNVNYHHQRRKIILPGSCTRVEDSAIAINVYEEVEFWKRILNLVQELLSAQVKAVGTNKQSDLINVFKITLSVTQSAVDVQNELESKNLVVSFFNDVLIKSVFNSLVVLFTHDDRKEILLMLMKFSRNILLLDEVQYYNERIRFQLMALLILSWLPAKFTENFANILPKSVLKRYFLLVDEELKEFCIVSLMESTRRFQFTQWQEKFFQEILTKQTSEMLELLPVLIHSLNDEELSQFFDMALSLGGDVLNEFSTHIRVLVCATDYQFSTVVRPKSAMPYVSCSRCNADVNLTNEPVSQIRDTPRRTILSELIIRVFSYSEETEYNVLCAVIDLFHHVPKTIELLNLLQRCFFSSNVHIRKKVIEITPYLVFRHPGVIESTSRIPEPLLDTSFEFCAKTFKNFMECLQVITLEALTGQDVDLQYVCLNAVVRIGIVKLSLESTLLPCVGILLNFLLNASSAYSSLAKSFMQQMAIAHNFEAEEDIYLKYREFVFPLVAQILVVNFSTYNITLNNLACEYASVFNEFTINHVLQYLLPHIARDSRLIVLINELAGLCNLTARKMLTNAFKHIFPHVMLFESSETAKSVMEMICKETGHSICELLGESITKVLAELFIHYEELEDKVKWVLKEIRILALPAESTSETSSSSERVVSHSSIESFLQSRFFGVLMKLENQLCSDMICKATRRRILSSFKSLILFTSSSYITSVRFKVLLTLRTIADMEKNNAPTYCIDIWDAFVRKLNTNVLGPILSTIFVSLMPFIQTHKERVNLIYRYLIIKNESVISAEYMLQLYFLPKEHCDEDICRIIEKSRKSLAGKCLEERLEWLLNATKHEITEIKLYALRYLKKELAANRADISRLILASDSVNRLVFRVLDVMVDGFRNLDVNIQQASGECLGEFGAIDPSYIPNMVIKENDAKKYNCYEIDDVEFVLKAFTSLCRGFQMAKTSASTDAFALAIQSLLNLYGMTQKEECKYWRQIPEQLREIILPFYSTTYTLVTYAHETNSKIPHLVYSSRKCSTVQKWAFNWSTFLISLLAAETKARTIFTFCKGPMSCEIKCMLLFLPHILLNAILVSDDENLIKIYEEMVSVVKDDSVTGNRNISTSRKERANERTCTQLMISEELCVISNSDQEMGVICTKIIFNLLDVLNKKFRDLRAASNGLNNNEVIKLGKFLGKFSRLQLAQKAFDRKEYTRSLLYLEEHLYDMGNKPKDERILALLSKIYFHLNDVDNVKGLFATHTVKLHQLNNIIMLHEITDQFQDAAICYQQLLKTSASVDEERALFYEKRAIQSYLAINQPELALRFVNSLSSAKTKPLFYDVECEALWNLSQFDKLEKLTACRCASEDENWGVRIGQSLVYLLKGQREFLEEELSRIRTTLTKSLHMSTAALGGYRECYEHIVKLHILNEFEKVADLVFGITETRNVSVEQWKTRFNYVIQFEFDERLNKLQPTSRVLQPVLNMRQAMFAVASRRLVNCDKGDFVRLFDEEIQRCWLKVIEMANRTRNFELAYSNIIAIDNYQLKAFFIEKAKYYWEKREQQEALRTLQHGLQFHYSKCRDWQNGWKYSEEDRKICAEALMLLGSYNDTIANSDSRVNLDNFTVASKVYPQSEKSLVRLAQYQEKVISASGDIFLYPKECEEIVKNYGESLFYGCEFIYQSLSKMLNIWLDLAERWYNDQKQQGTNMERLQLKRKKSIESMTKCIKHFLLRLPNYYFLTAFSLIMSRLMHPLSECFGLLQSIIVHCILAYPNQALWQFTSMCRPRASSSDAARKLSERANRVLNQPELNGLMKTVCKFREIFREFSQLCLESKRRNVRGKTNVTSLISASSNLLKESYYEEILIPAQKFITIVLPRSASTGVSTSTNIGGSSAIMSASECGHNPFPEKMTNIVKIRHEAFVYSSLQKPVRVTVLGTDGRSYPMIFKAMDDLRIDSRAMEFNAVVNMYLKRDAEARNRALMVRTYTVLPLYETNGIIEFIPNLDSMRNICMKMRRHIGLPDLKLKPMCELKDSMEKKRKVFREYSDLCKPVLHEWYKMEFPNPSSWYTARTSYVRTLAVMSVVGYILGLGDRHNDNILLDRTNGDIVHVDFNALFNKGETLPWPERVPFRLTHSMITTMGPLGYEGCFRYTCEIVNRIVRAHKDQLISILNTFLYDPSDFLNEVSRNRRSTMVFEVAAEKLRDVEARMNGVVRVSCGNVSMPLSVEGQVSKLIEEATDEDNLCQMFHGWGAYM